MSLALNGNQRSDRTKLADLLERNSRALCAGALSAGLTEVRPRSSPSRIAAEAQGFVAFLAHELRNSAAKSDRHADWEIREGAFAAAGPSEVQAIFSLWRRALASFLAAIAASPPAGLLDQFLNQLEERAASASTRWAARRVDVIVVGTSAGGVTALSRLLAALNSEIPVTLLIVLHVSPNAPTLLPEILARSSGMSIAAAVENASLYLGHAYVAPPGKHMIVSNGRLSFADGPAVHFVKPSVDVLFESAAANFGSHVASLVLTGTGADGATGTRAIAEHHGYTMAEDPKSAEFPGMPAAAIATGAVRQVIPLTRLARALRDLALKGAGELRQVR